MCFFAINGEIKEIYYNNCPICKNQESIKGNQPYQKVFYFDNCQVILKIDSGVCQNCKTRVYPIYLFPILNYFIEFTISILLQDKIVQRVTYKKIIKIFTEQYKRTKEPINFFLDTENIKKIFIKLCKLVTLSKKYSIINNINDILSCYNELLKMFYKKDLFLVSINTKLYEEKKYVKEEIIYSLSDYVEKTSSYKKNKMMWFRGQSNIEYNLRPSVYRINDDDNYEQRIIKHFMLRAPGLTNNCPAEQCYHQWLPFMQHYELPTRLLDWTDSPLCALFFALLSDSKSDACVYIFNPIEWNYIQYIIRGIPIIDISEEDELKKMINSAFEDNMKITNIKPMAITSVRKYERMYNQQANFTIHDSAIDMAKLFPNSFVKIIIPSHSKENIFQELFDMGIDKTTFFPELTALAEVTKKFA